MADPLGPLAWGPLPPLRSAGPEAVKLGSLATLLAVTLVCGLLPLRLLPPGSSALRRDPLGLLGRFAGGVFLATCLLDLLPGYLGAIKGVLDELRVTLLFPLPEFILSMGFFLVLILEQIVLACKDPQEEEEGESKETPRGAFAPPHEDAPSGLRLGALLLSLCLSSGLRESQGGSAHVLEPSLSLLLHRGLLAFALGLRLAQGGLRGRVVAAGVALFGAAPLLGLALAQEGAAPASSPLPRLSRSVLQGLAAGALLYLSCSEAEGATLPHGTRPTTRQRQRILQVTVLLAGFALLTALLFLRL